MDKTDSYNVTAEADHAHDDQWLADAIVTLHVACRSEAGFYYLVGQSASSNIAKYFVRDPRVAMALMEKATKLRFDLDIEYSECGAYPNGLFGVGIELGITGKNWDTIIHNESLPRAITEACVEALS